MTISSVTYSYAKMTVDAGMKAARSAKSLVAKNPVKAGLVAAAVVPPCISPAGFCVLPAILSGWGLIKADQYLSNRRNVGWIEHYKGIGSLYVGLAMAVVATVIPSAVHSQKTRDYSILSDRADNAVTQEIADGQKNVRSCEKYTFYKNPFLSYKQATVDICSTGQLMAAVSGYAMYKLNGEVTTIKLNIHPHP